MATYISGRRMKTLSDILVDKLRRDYFQGRLRVPYRVIAQATKEGNPDVIWNELDNPSAPDNPQDAIKAHNARILKRLY